MLELLIKLVFMCIKVKLLNKIWRFDLSINVSKQLLLLGLFFSFFLRTKYIVKYLKDKFFNVLIVRISTSCFILFYNLGKNK